MQPVARDVVVWSVCVCLCMVSVCEYVTEMNPAKTAEPIEMPFGMWAWVGPSNPLLDGGSGTPQRKGQFWELENEHALSPYRSRCRLACGLEWAQVTMYYIGVRFPMGHGQFWCGQTWSCPWLVYNGAWILRQKWALWEGKWYMGISTMTSPIS